MKYRLISPPSPIFTTIEQVLLNRGIDSKDLNHYLMTTDKDICDYKLLNMNKLKRAAKALISTISSDKDCYIVVDADCDGFTSSAILINYLYKVFPSWTKNHIKWFIHNEKEHGLGDMPINDWTKEENLNVIICPDAASNDFNEHKILKDANKIVICLDHHEADKDSEDAIVINSQFNNYPNKQLSGAGVSWQFCRFLDSLLNKEYADDFLDLAALGLTADMMSLTSFETKRIINKGFEEDNLKNPFISEMRTVNSFSIGGTLTPNGAAFYIAPIVNAVVRVGTAEEKELLFKSMLTMTAFEVLPSTKRGHKPGDTEILYKQAVRVSKNVKNRQDKAVEEGLAYLEKYIEEHNLINDNNKALIFTLEKGVINKNIVGLCANKEMAKYECPCCILTKGEIPFEKLPDNWKEHANNKGIICYQGSARGCDKKGITNFKDISIEFDKTIYAAGHQGAFGLGIPEEDIDTFIKYINIRLADMPTEAIYNVDFEYPNGEVDEKEILDISCYSTLWGKGMEEPLVAIDKVRVLSKDIALKARNTLIIHLPCGVTCIKYFADPAEYEKLQENEVNYLSIIGTCSRNEYYGNVTPQIILKDYEIISSFKVDF